jgi:hypothetical protein
METLHEKDTTALGSLFQQIITDLKVKLIINLQILL